MSGRLPDRMPANAVAVIGAGPAGLASARWLVRHGFEPVLFEAADRLGGQWNLGGPTSAVWPGMRTNTSRVMTAFSDLDHPEGTAVYPRHDQMLGYLERYAAQFGLADRVRLKTRVERIERAREGGWEVRVRRDGQVSGAVFARVVVATGRQTTPEVPAIPGIETFSGALGAAHSSQYAGVERYRGRSVVVAGCSISALEIASELALGGAARVTAAYRRQRYVLPKIIAGTPTDHVMFTRAAALAGEVAPPEAVAAAMKAKVLAAAGDPSWFGAPAPDPDIFAAGITQAQSFLPAVAEGRIEVRAFIERVEGRSVRFTDGSARDADAIVLATGYRVKLPWLSEEIAAHLNTDGRHLDLHAHTFHPDLPGLAFAGLYEVVGPTFPVLELQARWLAARFAGAPPSRAEMEAGIAQARAARGGPSALPMHALALLFARLAGVEPSLERWPALERALLFGPLSPASFRLEGPDSLADAPERAAAGAAAFGAITAPEMTAEEAGLRDMIRAAKAAAAA